MFDAAGRLVEAGGGIPFIKRVIGLPATPWRSTMARSRSTPWPSSSRTSFENSATDPPAAQSHLDRPNGRLFVLGDHRATPRIRASSGPIEKSSVIGRAWLRYWPLNVFGILQTPTYPGVPAAAP